MYHFRSDAYSAMPESAALDAIQDDGGILGSYFTSIVAATAVIVVDQDAPESRHLVLLRLSVVRHFGSVDTQQTASACINAISIS